MFRSPLRLFVSILVAHWSLVLLFAQPAPFMAISPGTATILVGQTRRFRAVDEQGRTQHNVHWMISDPAAFSSEQGDELLLTAKHAGEFRINAYSGDKAAEATIKVVEGNALPMGSVIWSQPQPSGCKATKIIQAMPTENGPATFEQSECPDGTYLRAFSADGVQMWRRKIDNAAAATVPGLPDVKSVPHNRLNENSASVCDLVTVGSEQEKVRDLLKSQNLSFTEDAHQKQVWLVDEGGTQCKLWFDGKAVIKKRKILVVE